jgi:large subunit ribosomal protein L4
MRQGTHDTKGRSEVRGGGKKPWRQKGTGRARQGSTRAPQWVGGGTVFGPTPRSYAFKLNKKVKQLGLKNVLTYKVNENQLIAVENVTLADAKTKNFVKLLANIKAEGKTVVVVAPEEFNETQVLASRNVAGVFLTPANNASVYELLCYKNLVLTEAAVKYFEEVLK